MARPIGMDSTRVGGQFTAGPLDRYVLQEMLVSVQDVVAEPLSGKRYAIRDPLTMETLGHSGMKTLKPEWMRDQKKGGGEYYEPEETELVLQSLLDGVWPKTAKRDRIAEAIDTALHSDAELEKGRAFGAGVDPRALPAAGEEPDRTTAPAAGLVPFDVPALPTSRPRVGLDDETGTLVLAPRSPLKGRFSQVNPPAKSKHDLALFASQEYREQRRKGLTPKAASEEATRQVWEHFPREARRFGVPAPVSVQGSLFTVPRTMPRGGLRPRGAQATDLGPLFGGAEGPRLPFDNPAADSAYGVASALGYSYIRGEPLFDRGVVFNRFQRSASATYPAVFVGFVKGRPVLYRAGSATEEAELRRGENPLTRTETAAVLQRARMSGKLARTFAGWPEGVARAAKMAAYQEVAQDFGQAGGPKGRAARRTAAFGPAAPGDPDYLRNVPAHILDTGWRAHKAAKKAGASEADAKAAGLRAVWAQYPAEAAAWGLPRGNPANPAWHLLTFAPSVPHANRLADYLASHGYLARLKADTAGTTGLHFYGSEKRAGGARLLALDWLARHGETPRHLLGNPPRVLGPIPGRMKEIRYQRTGRDRGPYFHKFGPNVRAFACADGSVILRGPRPLFVNQ